MYKKIFGNKTFFAEYGLSEEEHLSFQEVDFVKGCCIAFRKSILEKVGFLDENIFMYFEEIDLCYRIKQEGNKVLYNPQPKVIHLGGQSYRLLGETVCRRLNSQKYFFRKHYGYGHAFAMKWVVVVGALFKLTVFLLFCGFAGKEKRPYIKSKLVWSLYTLKWFVKDII